jgi:ribosomal protein S18 acetylase RimI-like enzyme
MNEITSIVSKQPLPAPPSPRVDVNVRRATLDDLAAIDRLQKMHSKQLGFFPRAQMEGYLKNDWLIVAEDASTRGLVGYCASRDRYLKRDELGAIFQLCVDPGAQRKFVGALLLKSVFERSAYGTKLYCCWCAQDLEASRFWEACGFVPLAFRTGARGKGKNGAPRMHIFWEKRIREGDTATPWWFPSQTGSGAMREDRLVFPIPPGMNWWDQMPVVLPGAEAAPAQRPCLPGKVKRNTGEMPAPRALGGIGFGRVGFRPTAPPKTEKLKKEKAPRVKVKNDPKFIAAARELRDRWLERVNEDPSMLLSSGKYEVSKALGGARVQDVATMPALPAPGSAGSPQAMAA